MVQEGSNIAGQNVGFIAPRLREMKALNAKKIDVPAEAIGLFTGGLCSPGPVTSIRRDVSPRITQDVFLMAGTHDHAVPFDQVGEQGRLLTAARSTTIRIFTKDEYGQMHCQMGNWPLAASLIEAWTEERMRPPAPWDNSTFWARFPCLPSHLLVGPEDSSIKIGVIAAGVA
jgi:hypothetical protein